MRHDVRIIDQQAGGAPSGETTDGSQKRRQILDGARDVFLTAGFDGASMNDIARVAGVSKGTLYVYFTSKDHLFETLIREDRRQQAEAMCDVLDTLGGPREVLDDFGRRLLEMMTRPETLAHVRAVVAVAGKFPQLGRAVRAMAPRSSPPTCAARPLPAPCASPIAIRRPGNSWRCARPMPICRCCLP